MASNFIQVWHGELLSTDNKQQNYWALLSDEEKRKAQSYTRQELKQKYINTRGMVRNILARYLAIEPRNLTIKMGPYGKPFLADSLLHFNLSHTANKFVLVVSDIENVGIDVESCQQRKNIEALVKKCFSEQEQAYWQSLPVSKQTIMFYHFWVRKEAFVKAVGRGLALGLNQCEIDIEQQNYFLSVPVQYGQAFDWKIIDIELDANSICAVVTKNKKFSFQYTELK